MYLGNKYENVYCETISAKKYCCPSCRQLFYIPLTPDYQDPISIKHINILNNRIVELERIAVGQERVISSLMTDKNNCVNEINELQNIIQMFADGIALDDEAKRGEAMKLWGSLYIDSITDQEE